MMVLSWFVAWRMFSSLPVLWAWAVAKLPLLWSLDRLLSL
jgi:hypothetical protein